MGRFKKKEAISDNYLVWDIRKRLGYLEKSTTDLAKVTVELNNLLKPLVEIINLTKPLLRNNKSLRNETARWKAKYKEQKRLTREYEKQIEQMGVKEL